MKKIINWYLSENAKNLGYCATGIMFETEDNKFYTLHSTDLIAPYSEINREDAQ